MVVVPFSVPTLSTIAAAMGRGDVGKKWLGSSEQQTQKSELDKSRAKLLDTMRSGMQGGRPQAAVAAFMKWASENDDKVLYLRVYVSVLISLNIFFSPVRILVHYWDIILSRSF